MDHNTYMRSFRFFNKYCNSNQKPCQFLLSQVFISYRHRVVIFCAGEKCLKVVHKEKNGEETVTHNIQGDEFSSHIKEEEEK